MSEDLLLRPSAFNTLPTIIFKNKALNNGLTVWISPSAEEHRLSVARLKGYDHIEIVAVADSHVAREIGGN